MKILEAERAMDMATTFKVTADACCPARNLARNRVAIRPPSSAMIHRRKKRIKIRDRIERDGQTSDEMARIHAISFTTKIWEVHWTPLSPFILLPRTFASGKQARPITISS